MATNVRYALQQCCLSPVNGCSLSILTPISIDVFQAAFTVALRITTIPFWTGCKVQGASIDAVTTGMRQKRCAETAAQMSTQAAIWSRMPCRDCWYDSAIPTVSFLREYLLGFESARTCPTFSYVFRQEQPTYQYRHFTSSYR